MKNLPSKDFKTKNNKKVTIGVNYFGCTFKLFVNNC